MGPVVLVCGPTGTGDPPVAPALVGRVGPLRVAGGHVTDGRRARGLCRRCPPSTAGASTHSTWLVDDIGLAPGERWSALGSILLAAVAGRVCALGARQLVIACPSADRTRRDALAAAGLDLTCWFRHARLDQVIESVEPVEHPDGPGLPLPHLHGLTAALATATSVTAPGAHALVAGSVAPPPVFVGEGTTTLADPVIAAGAPSLWGVIRAIETTARTRGDAAVVVAAGPGEEPLDEVLEQRGYGRPVEWWVLRRQLQPLVEPHSWHT